MTWPWVALILGLVFIVLWFFSTITEQTEETKRRKIFYEKCRVEQEEDVTT